MNVYQQIIYKSRYAKWIDDLGRRENYEETVRRYWSHMKDKAAQHGLRFTAETEQKIISSLLSTDVLPSMRGYMSAGPALDRDEGAIFNCAFIGVDSIEAFGEILFTLMLGTGVGFSVEKAYISKLPVVPVIGEKKDSFIVEDSKEGWADAIKFVIDRLYSGVIPEVFYHNIRAKGAKLKVFGGRASGPQPLIDLVNFTKKVFTEAQGRQLKPIEVHDIVCKIAACVVSGGVRRSAMISISDLNDTEMRDAKSGNWWESNVQRALANNSAAYNERPSQEVFWEEWNALAKSGSGERGIFNRAAAVKKAESIGRKLKDGFGTNPCVTGDTWVLTSEGHRRVSQLVGRPFDAIVDGKAYESVNGFWSTGVKPVYRVITDSGQSIRATDNHKFLVIRDGVKTKVELGNIAIGEELVVGDNGFVQTNRESSAFNTGWLIGQIVGDGGHNPEKYNTYVRFWGEHAFDMYQSALQRVKSLMPYHSAVVAEKHDTMTLSSVELTKVADRYLYAQSKRFKDATMMGDDNFIAGVLSGWFDTDGSVQGNSQKGYSIRLTSVDIQRLSDAQLMLLRLGIPSKIHFRKDAGPQLMPDGKGGKKEYHCQALYELIISRNSIIRFSESIGFTVKHKADRLASLIASYRRAPYSANFTTRITDIVEDGSEEVFDCTVNGAHLFNANGLNISNCGEISINSRQFCNLTSISIRADDTEDRLLEKVEIATILGTVQSLFDGYRYINSGWAENQERERLLGVSLSGIVDNLLTNGTSPELTQSLLTKMRARARTVNAEYATKLNINVSAAITTVKPEGTTSQMTGCSSGIHPAYSRYYIRRVRMDDKDPISQFLIDQGIPYEVDTYNPSAYVFEFPIKTADTAIQRLEMNAIGQLELYKLYQRHWADHNVSNTVYVKEDEWEAVGRWVWDNFDEISGVSFLPFDNGTYVQAPYEEINIEEYEKRLSKMPESIDWNALPLYEIEDATTGVQQLACTSGECEIPAFSSK